MRGASPRIAGASAGFRRVRRLALGRAGLAREVDDELAFHLESAVRDLVASGLGPGEAREEALRRFGDLERYRRSCHQIGRRRLAAARRGEIMGDLLHDLRLAVRTFRKSPAFLAGTVLTLALGIGGTTAIFSVVWGVLGKPLPFSGPDRLVHLWEKNPERGWMFNVAAPANFLDWRARVGSFAEVTAYGFDRFQIPLVEGDGEPEMLSGWQVYPNFFSVLGVEPALGRGFAEEEAWVGRTEVVVVSHDLWRRRLGGDPEIVGKPVTLSGRPRTVVGVAPAGFRYPAAGVDVWTPFEWKPENRQAVWFRRAHYVNPVARLKPGVSLEAARAELELVASQLEKEYPETNRLMGAGLTPLHEWVVGKSRRALLVLLGAVGLVLAIACANVAHLQLTRTTPRHGEMQVRSALGASRARLVRQLLTESLLLALAAGALGLLVASWATRALLALAPPDLPRAGEVRVDGVVLAFALVAAVATGLGFGLAPAFRASRSAGNSAWSAGWRATAGRPQRRARGLLVVAEIGLALVLVAGAGLLGRSFLTLRAVDPGFSTERILTFGVSLAGSRYREGAAVAAYFDQLTERVRALPGVEAAAFADGLPLDGSNWTSDFAVEGRAREDYGVEVHHRTVSPGYFRTLGVPLVAGRDFTPADRADEPRVVLINEALRDRYFADENPLGKRLCFDRYPAAESVWRTVVGVVGDERVEGLARGGRPEILEAFAQNPVGREFLVVRAAGDPLALLPAIRAAAREIDREQPLFAVRTMEQIAAGSVVRERFLTLLVGLFAAMALLLAAIGTYSVIAFGVAQRRREIGIRRALGARGDSVVGLVLRQGLSLTAAGLAAGLAGALAATRLLRGLLFEVSPTDPGTLAAVALLLAAVALLASYLPARRAAHVDPAIALREE